MTTMSLPLLEWEQARPLVVAAVVREGYPSLTAYADTLPQADLLDLACILAIAGVHSGHLSMGLWEEATSAGAPARCARGLLVRAICTRLRECEESGSSRVRYLEDAFYQWRSQLPLNYRCVEEQIREAVLLVPPPVDWIPEHADDSILVSLFRQHWPIEPAGCRYRMIVNRTGGITIESRPPDAVAG
jgi:hypothetical protein